MKFSFKIEHIVPIAITLILPLLGLIPEYMQNQISVHLLFVKWIVGAIFLLIIWYLMKYFNGPQFNFKMWQVFLGTIFVFFFLRSIPYFLGHPFRWRNLPGSSFAIVLIQIIQYALKTQENLSKLKVEKEQLISENYKAELKALRAQIDPHFLFNSLNTLRSMVRNQNTNSEQFVMSLSDFYRQTFNNHKVSTISLSEEMSVLESYLFLMKNRNERAIVININIDGEWENTHLPALALQVSVENCFKHNSMTTKSPLIIDITTTSNGYIAVRNNIQPKIGEVEKSGRGIDMLKKRYELMNIEKGVIIDKNSEHFRVQLKLLQK
tara:strand:+ start:1228 stop:2196 length:969 start_codon:yes stop_codon:yes gene_type:complete